MARNFDGISNDLVDCGADSTVNDLADGGGSFLFWINTTSDGQNNFGQIVNKRGATGTLGSYAFDVADESAGNCVAELFFDWTTTDGYWITSARDIVLGQWMCLLWNYDADAAANNPELFIDGASKTVGSGLTESSTPAGTRRADSGKNLIIGNRDDVQNVDFDGDIAFVTAWGTTTLSANEAQALANGVNMFAIRPENRAISIALWGNQSPEADLSGNGNTGTVTGTTKVPGPPVELLENYL